MRIEIYQDASLQWRWRGIDDNFRIICDGSEGYLSRFACERGIDNVMGEFRGDVHVVTRDRRRAAATISSLASGEPRLTDRRTPEGIGPVYAEFVTIAEYQHEGAKK